MWKDYNSGRSKRFQKEAKRLERQAQRDGELRGRDAARLNKLRGRIRNGVELGNDDGDYDSDSEW